MDADDRIGIEFISALGMSPVAFVGLAADLGCRRIGIGLEPIVRDEAAYAPWSLRDDAGLRRDTIAALRDSGVSIALGEGFMATPRADISGCEADLDLMAELGVRRVNMLVYDSDCGRAFDQCARFAALAGARDMDATLEFLPLMPPVIDFATALDAVRHVGRSNFGVLIDTMHLFRSGGTAAHVAAADPAAIGYVQICDVPIVSRHADYADEARFDRLVPGDGELPLAAFVATLPDGIDIGVEVPMMTAAKAGVGAHERLSRALDATRALVRTAQPDAIAATR